MSFNTLILSAPLNVSENSNAAAIPDMGLYSIQAAFTGSTCSFTAKVQVSSDPYGPLGTVAQPVNWDDLASSSQTFTQAGTYTWDVGPTAVSWVRLVITDNSSGTNNGSITARINSKGPL
jgi:hypothetical protein